MIGGLANWVALFSLPTVFPEGSPIWLTVNVLFDLILGGGVYISLVLILPRISHFIRPYWNAGANKGKGAWLPMGANMESWRGIFHFQVWIAFVFVKVIAFAVGIIGITATLFLSIGWQSPLSMDGLFYDLIYARTNTSPNSAHLLSETGVALFAVVVCYKFVSRPFKRFEDVMGNPFQGIAAGLFLGGIHEAIWLPLYYSAYSQYLNWTLLPEVLRDVSFAAMIALFIITYWKIPGRQIPLSIYKWPIVALVVFNVAWFVVPPIFGYPLLPITTINNPAYATGPYQQTPLYDNPVVNGIEVFSWVMLWASCIFVTLRYRGKQ